MSGFGGFGGFGQQNNQQQSTGFGGFGSNNSNNNTGTTGGFGGFGANNNTNNTNTGGGIFGASTGGFGASTGGGFGSNNNATTSPFGAAKPAFGATNTSTGGGLFGSNNNNTTSTGFGGFGANNNQSTGFGSSSTGTGLFGQNKPATGFGASTTNNTSGGGLFGATTGSFGAGTSGGFGSGATTGFGAVGAGAQNNGTEHPFDAVNEKDGPAGQSVTYQSISCMEGYKGFSPEELRVADYAKGRRYGNANGQAGAFGQNTGFGGFGTANNNTGSFGASNNTGGGLFGQNNATQNTTGAFGQTNNTTGAFGSNTGGGGLFGQNKPAGGGLFGAATTTSSTTGGGLFGTANNTGTTAFGGGTTGGFGSNNNSGGGLFGNNANNNQAKPAFGGFGTANTTTTNAFGSGTTSAFGQNNNTGGGLFGGSNNANATQTSAFGSNNQQTGGAFGGFGHNNQTQPAAQTSGGGLFGGGAFGQNNQAAAKPSLFGATNNTMTGGGLFGQNNNATQNTGGGLFGNANATNNNSTQGGGLFGAKPATGGLFGNTQNNSSTTGGGLFGNLNNNQQQQNQGGGLFGNNNQTQNKPLFGASAGTGNTGGGLFGGLNQNQQNQQQGGGLGGSLFGNSQNNQQQNNMGGSLFGSQNSNRPQGLVASLDNYPYGNEQLFAHLETPSQSVGPIATPLSSSQKPRKNALLPQHKLNPAASTRLITPQKRPPAGFGFTYSTYGTPGSGAPPSSGFANNLLGGTSFGRSLGKSFSTSNLRGSFRTEDSILAPGAFSSAPRGYASGSLKRLQINRSINTAHALFASQEPSSLKKSVTFENGTAEGSNGALTRTEESDESPQRQITNGEPAPLRSAPAKATATPTTNGTSPTASAPAVAPADASVKPTSSVVTRSSAAKKKKKSSLPTDPVKEDCAYWSKPTIDELKAMTPQQRKSLPEFVVGRENLGHITYHNPDLSKLPLDEILGKLVYIGIRKVAAYSDKHWPYPKPPMGQGKELNVPATCVVLNSWILDKNTLKPLHEGREYDKHVSRLKRQNGAEFLSFDSHTGTWTFKVQHWSVYGLDDDDQDETSMLSAVPDTPTPKTRTPGRTPTSAYQGEETMIDGSDSGLDDTFEFQKRRRPYLPGGFGEESMLVADELDAEDETQNGQSSFLDERSVGSLLERDETMQISSDEEESSPVQDQDMAGSFPVPTQTTELNTAFGQSSAATTFQPKSILKASQINRAGPGTPGRGAVDLRNDWAEQLQRTISPKKRDRQMLKESQGTILKERKIAFNDSVRSVKADKPFRTSMDLMRSLYGEEDDAGAGNKKQATRTGLRSQVPFPKKSKTVDATDFDAKDQAFHQTLKPRWSADGTLTYTIAGSAPQLEDGFIINIGKPIVGEVKDIRFAQVATPDNALPESIKYQRSFTTIKLDKSKVPHAITKGDFSFADLAAKAKEDDRTPPNERYIWELASILFDEVPIDAKSPFAKQLEASYRKEKLSEYWQRLVQDDADKQVSSATSKEQAAVQYLSAHDIPSACAALLEGRNPRLATMIAQIGGSESLRKEVVAQLDQWRSQNVLSEITEPIRALYELLSGNCAVCKGKSGAGVENKANNFKLASRFGLDWRRAFGLRLWYGTLPTEDIPMAVAQFESDVREGREEVKPVPWFVEQNANTDWTASDPNQLEDVLWGLLKLYAAQSIDLPVNIEEIFAPANTSGNPLDARLSWQLLHLFNARKEIKLPITRRELGSSMASSTASSKSSSATSDATALDTARNALTLTFGALIEDTNAWVSALWIYTHLTSPTLRTSKIKQVLALKAYDFDIPVESHLADADTSNTKFTVMTSTLRIPEAWLHSAKALYARAVLGDPAEEILHLLAARDFVAAHDVLCGTVAPQAVIAREYDVLRDLLPGFEGGVEALNKSAAGTRTWATGGQMYFDFIHLLDTAHLKSSSSSKDGSLRSERERGLRRLVSALEKVGGWLDEGKLGVEERAGVWEMGRVVSGWMKEGREGGKGEEMDVTRLPLMEDGWLRCARQRGVEYFRGVLAIAR